MTSPTSHRLLWLDVVRGVALSGILFTNVFSIVRVADITLGGPPTTTSIVLAAVVEQRFFPIFSFLFGISFGLLWHSASRRGKRPRVTLLRRLLFLVVLGAVHQLFQPGEALFIYGLAGIVILLPLTFAPATVLTSLVLGSVFLVAGVVVGGGVALVPGFLALGFALGTSDKLTVLEQSWRVCGVVAAAGTALSIPLVWWQLQDPAHAGFNVSNVLAGLAMAVGYVGIVTQLLHTPVRKALGWFFAPLGKMALSNYVGATVVATLAAIAIPWATPAIAGNGDYTVIEQSKVLMIWVLCALLVIVQSLVSSWWLRSHRYGPLELVWRYITWGKTRQVPARTGQLDAK